MAKKIIKCFDCSMPLVFENTDGKVEEYEVDENGNKRCFVCHNDLIGDER